MRNHYSDRGNEWSDHVASTEPDEFQKMIEDIRVVKSCLGNGEKCSTEEERAISSTVRKRVVGKTQIHEGDILSPDNFSK